jgi:hypothetical protein
MRSFLSAKFVRRLSKNVKEQEGGRGRVLTGFPDHVLVETGGIRGHGVEESLLTNNE